MFRSFGSIVNQRLQLPDGLTETSRPAAATKVTKITKPKLVFLAIFVVFVIFVAAAVGPSQSL